MLRLKGKITFKITLTEKFITDNLLKQIEKANDVVPFSSFLCKDAFENFLNETDFIIKCEEQEFHFNKTLLCLVSDVFRTMIQGKLGSEARSGFVEILDTSPDTIKAFQKIVFENKDFEKETPTIDLLMFADKYLMAPLKQKCTKYLASNLTLDNVHDVIKTAELIQDDNLVKFCTMFLEKQDHN